jgi:hypothetical protein
MFSLTGMDWNGMDWTAMETGGFNRATSRVFPLDRNLLISTLVVSILYPLSSTWVARIFDNNETHEGKKPQDSFERT